MNGMGYERSELEDFDVKCIIEKNGSFNGPIVLCHLELLMSAKKLQTNQASPVNFFCLHEMSVVCPKH